MKINLPDYKVIRSRRRTLGLQVTEEGVVVRAPFFSSEAAIRRFVGDHLEWIERQKKRVERISREASEVLPLTEAELRALKKEARADLTSRVRHYASLMGVSYARISIRAMRSRWGSCSREGNLSFNCLLMLAPPEVRDATVVHELSHRRHMNHSQAFYQEVLRYCPDYKKTSRWLKEHGAALIRRLPGKSET